MARIILTASLLIISSLSLRSQTLPASPVNIDSLIKAQANDSMLAQLVDSRKGFVARIPAQGRLDSTRSGWNPKELYERRTYVIDGAGAIVFTAIVKPLSPPPGATVTQAYTYFERDSLTSAGTAWVRTYYLPTRSIRIEIIPYGIAMRKYIEERERIFNSFRWKPGAETEAIDIEGDPVFTPPTMLPGGTLDQG